MNYGYDIAKCIHDQLINDLETGHSPRVNTCLIKKNKNFDYCFLQKRYTQILNSNCQFVFYVFVCKTSIFCGSQDLRGQLTKIKPYSKTKHCQFVGFSLVRNEEKSKDFIVIYYYPMKKSEDLWEFDHKIADI